MSLPAAFRARLHHTRTRLRARAQQGDVPGWVLVTGMTVALVMVVLGIARAEITQIVQNAFNSVSFGP